MKEDELADQMSLKEYVDPFTGRENKKAQRSPLRVSRKKECGRQTFSVPL